VGADSGLGGSPYAGLVAAGLVREHWRQQDLRHENYLRANQARAAILARGDRPVRLDLPEGYTYVADHEWEQAYIEAWTPKPEPETMTAKDWLELLKVIVILAVFAVFAWGVLFPSY
jgi:hypothetical protein